MVGKVLPTARFPAIIVICPVATLTKINHGLKEVVWQRKMIDALSESITLCHDWMLVDGTRGLFQYGTTIALTISLSSGAYYHTHFARRDTNVEMPKPVAHFEKHGLRLRLHCFAPPSTLEYDHHPNSTHSHT